MTLFVRSRTAQSDLWEGPRAGFEGAINHFGADEVVDMIEHISSQW
jgi:hypothetical protein